jgi:hypothetical protein
MSMTYVPPPTRKVISGELSSRLYQLSRLCESHIPEDDFSQREESDDAPRQRILRITESCLVPGQTSPAAHLTQARDAWLR